MKHTCELRRGMSYKCKFFEIGMPRTASRSVCMAVRMLGLHAKHGSNYCKRCNRDMVEKYLAERMANLMPDLIEVGIESAHFAKVHALASPAGGVAPADSSIFTFKTLMTKVEADALEQG